MVKFINLKKLKTLWKLNKNKKREKILTKLTQEAEDMGFYNPPFDNPLIKQKDKNND